MKFQVGIFLLAALLAGGCETEHFVSDAKHPEVVITPAGGVKFRGRFVDPEDLPGLLRRAAYDPRDTIYISAPDDMGDWRLKRKVMGILSRNGFTRPVLLGEVHASSSVGRTGDERRRDERRAREQQQLQQQTQPKKREVRYK